MNGVKFLLDTNIVIGLLNRSETVICLLTQQQVAIRECAFSAITRMELLSYHGLKPADRQTIERLLSRMNYLPITSAIEDATIAFRQKNKGKLPDAIIAATAGHHQLELLTLDTALAGKY
ncbi:type II toxin-antitoxin system VapC family toxin [uncultured Thiodictyon sp.]|uniref:type II toxin-antitoxin system VapC family toxin n=1 Tax=uncultured Thiodictyon sp. TaxID=1846217 RepID=UPI0025EEFDB6|nr:type II toxin-antitoxin system VapC family toxin [uncultured Thiodictyon sp.]